MWFGLLVLAVGEGAFGLQGTPLLSTETLERRSLTRFLKNHSDHTMCWERSVIRSS